MKRILNFIENKIILLIGFFFTIPFIVISLFNHPSSDDYCFASKVKDLGYLGTQESFYNNWTGRFVSTAILGIDILTDETRIWYKIFPVLLIFFLLISIYCFIKEVLGSKKGIFNLEISILIFLLYLTQMPIVSEGLYWWSGAITYQLANILIFFFLRSLVVILRRKSILNIIIASILGFSIAGLNEVSMLLLNVLIASILIINYYNSKRINLKVLIVFVIVLISSLIVVSAPGNALRGQYFPNQHNIILSIVLASFDSIRFIGRWIGLTLLVTLISYAKILKNIDRDYINAKLNIPINVCFLIFGSVVFIGFFIGFWSMGKPLPVRSVNTVYVFFIVGSITTLFSFLVQSKIKWDLYISNNILVLLLIVLSGSIMFDKKNMIDVINDLGKKTAYNYNIEMNERYLKTKTANKDEVLVLKPLENKPITILETDMKFDGNYFANQCYSGFWSLKGVILNNN